MRRNRHAQNANLVMRIRLLKKKNIFVGQCCVQERSPVRPGSRGWPLDWPVPTNQHAQNANLVMIMSVWRCARRTPPDGHYHNKVRFLSVLIPWHWPVQTPPARARSNRTALLDTTLADKRNSRFPDPTFSDSRSRCVTIDPGIIFSRFSRQPRQPNRSHRGCVEGRETRARARMTAV